MFELPIHAAFDINSNLFDDKAAKAQQRKNALSNSGTTHLSYHQNYYVTLMENSK